MLCLPVLCSPVYYITFNLKEGTYTERQKKLITSSERRSLIKIPHIKINHKIWTPKSYSTPYEAHLKNQRRNRKRSFFKTPRNCSLRTYLNKKPRINNFYSYSFNFNGELYNCRAGFCRAKVRAQSDFWKMASCDFTAFYCFLTQGNVCLDVLGKDYCAQLRVILMLWILVSVALKKWCLFWRSVYFKRFIKSEWNCSLAYQIYKWNSLWLWTHNYTFPDKLDMMAFLSFKIFSFIGLHVSN